MILPNSSSSTSRPWVLIVNWNLSRCRRASGLAEPTGGDLRVLLADGFHHVAGGKLLGGKFLRIEPDPQTVVARSQKRHIADTPSRGPTRP